MDNQFEELVEYFEVLGQDKSEHTIRAYNKAISNFCAYFNIQDLETLRKVDYKKILLYRNSLLKTGIEASSINTQLRSISAFFSYLVEHDYLTINPVKKIKNLKEEKKVKIVLTDKECEAMIDACINDNEKVIVTMLLATGARRGELVSIRVEDIYDGHVRLFGKGEKEREVPIQPSVYEYLQNYIQNRKKGDYIIVSQRGSHKVTPEAIRQTIKKVAERANIDPERLEKISCHTFRRTTASNLLNSGVESFFVRDFLGHNSLATTERYAKVKNDAMDRAVLANQKEILK